MDPEPGRLTSACSSIGHAPTQTTLNYSTFTTTGRTQAGKWRRAAVTGPSGVARRPDPSQDQKKRQATKRQPYNHPSPRRKALAPVRGRRTARNGTGDTVALNGTAQAKLAKNLRKSGDVLSARVAFVTLAIGRVELENTDGSSVAVSPRSIRQARLYRNATTRTYFTGVRPVRVKPANCIVRARGRIGSYSCRSAARTHLYNLNRTPHSTL